MPKFEFSLEESATLSLLSDLEYLVTSLAQVGSSTADLSQAEQAQEAYRFLLEGDVFRRLASMRTGLWSALEATLPHSEVERLERAMEDVPRWPDHRSG